MYFDRTAFDQGDCKASNPCAPEELSGASSFLRKTAAPRGCWDAAASQLSVSSLENGLCHCTYSAWYNFLTTSVASLYQRASCELYKLSSSLAKDVLQETIIMPVYVMWIIYIFCCID